MPRLPQCLTTKMSPSQFTVDQTGSEPRAFISWKTGVLNTTLDPRGVTVIGDIANYKIEQLRQGESEGNLFATGSKFSFSTFSTSFAFLKLNNSSSAPLKTKVDTPTEKSKFKYPQTLQLII